MPTEQKDSVFVSDRESRTSKSGEAANNTGTGREKAADEQQWDPRVLQPRVLSGLLALVITIACMFSALGVLVASDGVPKASWRVQPTVPLAILSAIGAAAIRYARGCASPVAWWYKALQGRTVKQLEDQWQVGRGIVGALTALRHGSWISLATLLTTVMIIDGAMLQRASSVALVIVPSNVTLYIPLSPEVPRGASGVEADGSINPSTMAVETLANYLGNTTMISAVEGCQSNSTCTGTAIGPGLSIYGDCVSRSWNITNTMLHDPTAQWGWQHGVSNTTMFSSTSQLIYTNTIFEIFMQPLGSQGGISPKLEPSPNLAGRSAQADGRGSFGGRACTVLPAVFEYDIEVNDGEISLPSGFNAGRFVAWANNTVGNISDFSNGGYPATLEFVTFALAAIWGANANATLWAHAPPGTTWEVDPYTFDLVVANYYDWTVEGCSFREPFDDIVASFNNIMFRMALTTATWSNVTSHIDAGLSVNQTRAGVQLTQENVYTSDYRWFAGAAVLDIIAVLVVLPLFWGWWALPTHLSRILLSIWLWLLTVRSLLE